MINNFNFHGTLNINFGCKHCSNTNNSNCGAFVHTMSLDFENNLLTFNIVGTVGTHVNMTLTPEGGEAVVTDCSIIGDTYSMSIDTFGSILGGNGTIALNAYSDECTTLLCSESFPFYTNSIEVPLEGDSLIVNPSGTSSCNSNLIYTELLNGVGGGITMDTDTGIVTIPAQTIDSQMPVYIYYVTCNSLITQLVIMFLGNPGGGGNSTMYSCNGNQCIEDQNGQYNDSNCYGNCNQQQTMYSCSGESCVEDQNGIYNNSNCDWACELPQLLGFIEFNDIVDSPVPGNSAIDWTTYMNVNQTEYSANFTSVIVDINKVSFYGIPQLNEKLYIGFYGGLSLVDYDFSGFTYMKEVRFFNVVGLSSFLPSVFPQLIRFSTISPDTTNFDFSSNNNLEKIDIQYGTINSINISNCINLTTFYVVGCSVPSLDFSNNVLLDSIVFRQCTGAATVNVTANTALTVLDASGSFNTLDVSNNINLVELYVASPNITNLDISTLTLLENISIESCTLITSLNTSNQPNLLTARIGTSGLLSFDPSSNLLLNSIWINDTAITTIDVSSNLALTYLKLNSCLNLLTSTFVSSLAVLEINYYPLTTLDLNLATNLENLYVIGGSLTTIDISNSNSWVGVRLEGNNISNATDINAILAHLVSIGFNGQLNISGGTNAAPTGQGILDVATLIGNGALVTTN